MKDRFILPLSLVVLSVNCGPERPPADAGKADSPGDVDGADGDEHQGDPWPCDEIGAACITPMGIGECIDSQCSPTLGECYPTFNGDCNAICALDGRSCADLGCEGATALGWNGTVQGEANAYCGAADNRLAIPLMVACDEPLLELAKTVSCCCWW